MSAQQATADGGGYRCGHKRRDRGGCRARKRDQNGEKCHGVIGRTTRGIAESFGIPRKGVLIAFILILVFSFPVGVMLFGIAWAFVHHPSWFDGLRGKFGGASRGNASQQARHDATATRTTSSSTAPEDRPTMGVDFEEPWMEELREKFDDLESRTGSMEGFVASGDYRLASELEKMKKDDATSGDDAHSKDPKNDPSSPNDKA